MLELKQFYYKKNRLHQLKGFYNVVQLGNITKAAKKMGLTQSTITLQIQSLERDLGVKLFSRKNNLLTLTSDGRRLYDMSSCHLHAIDSIYENFLNSKLKKQTSKISIAAHHISISHLLPRYIKKFTKLYPDVKMIIQNISLEVASERLLKDQIDLMIYPNVNISPEFTAKTIASFDPILIMNKNHPLALKKSNFLLKDIADYNVVRIDKKLISLPLFEATFKEFNFKTNIEFENSNWEIIKYYVKNDIGIGFVSTICVDSKDKDLVCISLNKYFPQMDYKLVVKSGKILNNVVSSFIKITDI